MPIVPITGAASPLPDFAGGGFSPSDFGACCDTEMYGTGGSLQSGATDGRWRGIVRASKATMGSSKGTSGCFMLEDGSQCNARGLSSWENDPKFRNQAPLGGGPSYYAGGYAVAPGEPLLEHTQQGWQNASPAPAPLVLVGPPDRSAEQQPYRGTLTEAKARARFRMYLLPALVIGAAIVIARGRS